MFLRDHAGCFVENTLLGNLYTLNRSPNECVVFSYIPGPSLYPTYGKSSHSLTPVTVHPLHPLHCPKGGLISQQGGYTLRAPVCRASSRKGHKATMTIFLASKRRQKMDLGTWLLHSPSQHQFYMCIRYKQMYFRERYILEWFFILSIKLIKLFFAGYILGGKTLRHIDQNKDFLETDKI